MGNIFYSTLEQFRVNSRIQLFITAGIGYALAAFMILQKGKGPSQMSAPSLSERLVCSLKMFA